MIVLFILTLVSGLSVMPMTPVFGLAVQTPSQAPAAQPAEQTPPEVPTAPEASAAEAIGREIEELARQRERLNESLEEIDRRAQEAEEARIEAVQEETERLEETRRELERTLRDVERDRADDQEGFERDDDGWVERARARKPNEKFGFGSTIKVRSRETVADVVVVAGGAKIDGDVVGDVTTFGGECKINGRVSGNVTAFGGDVELGPHARVEGDVSSVGGQIYDHPGAYVGGSRDGGASFDMGDFRGFERSQTIGSIFGWADWVQFFWALLFTGFLVVLAGLVYLILQRPVERVRDVAFDAPLRSFLTGFLILVLSIPALVAVMIVLAISIIGIPFLVILCLLLPFALIGFLVVLFYGYSAVALGVGNVLRSQLRLGLGSGLAMLAVGIVALRAMGLSGDLLDAIGLPAFVTVLFGFTAAIIQFFAVSVGLGAVVNSRLGLAAESGSGFVSPPDLPPIPEAEDDGLSVGVEFGADDEDLSDWMDDPSDDQPDRSR